MSRASISLRQALGGGSFVGCADLRARRISADSRRVQPGDVFVAIPGVEVDGHRYVANAIAAGASAVVLQTPVPGLAVPQCVVPSTRAAWSRLTLALHGNPERQLSIAGVTGTNGKTTTCWLLRSILLAHGAKCGLLGTIEYSDGISRESAPLTTPDAWTIAGLLERMAMQQVSHCVMEVSSHALDQERCAGIPLATAAVTNVTQDHFDYHRTHDHYRESKARIAEMLVPGGRLFVTADEPGCDALVALLPETVSVVRLGLGDAGDLQAEIEDADRTRQHVRFHLAGGEVSLQLALTGRHNVLNALTAAAMAESMGISSAAIVTGLQQLKAVPGRMERIDEGQSFQVFVDFAHTPDGLTHCLQTVREITDGRVICVFGAGGDRDRQKRPLMGEAVEAAADIAIVTSDNPRTEDPRSIIEAIVSGFQNRIPVTQDQDRYSAIQKAVEMSAAGDTIVIAGRGHETVQICGDREISFDDRKVVRSLLRKRIAAEAGSEKNP